MKTITLFLFGILILSLLIGGYYLDKNIERKVDINGLEIKPSQFSEMIDVVPEGEFVICNIDEDECFLFKKTIFGK